MSGFDEKVPAVAAAAVLTPNKSDISEWVSAETPKVEGFDFNKGASARRLLGACLSTGFQATNLGLAIQEINRWCDTSRAERVSSPLRSARPRSARGA